MEVLIKAKIEKRELSKEEWLKIIQLRLDQLKKNFRMLPIETLASKFGYKFDEMNFSVNGKVVKSFNMESLFKERIIFSKEKKIQNLKNNGEHDLSYWAITKKGEWLVIKIVKKIDYQEILISLVELEEIFDEINDLNYKTVFKNISEYFSDFTKRRKELYDEVFEISQILEFENSQI